MSATQHILGKILSEVRKAMNFFTLPLKYFENEQIFSVWKAEITLKMYENRKLKGKNRIS